MKKALLVLLILALALIAVSCPDPNAVAVTGVSLDANTLTMNVGQTAQLTATVAPTDADDPRVSWASSNRSVATVSTSGLVTSVAKGTASITVTTRTGNFTDVCAVNVAPDAPAGYALVILGDTYYTTPTTWPSHTIYLLNGNVVVTADFTIQPDVIVKLGDGRSIDIDSDTTFRALATSSEPIVFTSYRDDAHGGDTNGDGTTTTPAMGDWDQIFVRAVDADFSYCDFSYGGWIGHSVIDLPVDGHPLIEHSTFAYNSSCIDASVASVQTSIVDNLFYANDNLIAINGLISMDNSNSFSNGGTRNTHEGILISGGVSIDSSTVSWNETEVAFYTDTGSINVYAPGRLNLGNMVTVKFEEGLEFFIGNYDEYACDVSGIRPLDPPADILNVHITSYADDSYGGDTDGVPNAPMTGWLGVWDNDDNLSGTASYVHAVNILNADN